MFSDRANQVAPSATVELNAKVAQMIRDGEDVIKLNIGEPDFDTPAYIKDAAKKAIDDGFTKYTAVPGIPELRKAICQKLQEENNIPYQDTDICVTTGAKQALFESLITLVQEGDEVILPIPCWVSYEDMTKLSGAQPVLVPTINTGEDRFHLDIEAIKRAVTNKTKAVIINTPNNPTGVVYQKKELKSLSELAEEYGLWIISDEVYEKLIYNDAQHISIASLSEKAYSRTITINGFSKAFAMTGWRVGYAAGPKEFIQKMKGIQGHVTSGINSISQKAALAAYTMPQNSVAEMCAQFSLRREMVYDRLKRMKDVECSNALGAFYLLPDFSAYFGKHWQGGRIKNSFDLANYLLSETKVAVVPGDSFRAPGCLRISYSNSMERLREGMDRIEAGLATLK